MAKRCRELYSDGTAAEMAEFKTVFVDTSLDTHLAMLVSSSDTVLEFKKKIMLEHKQCFPTIGEILIHSLKVKRRSNFYHLPDIMLVWSAFHGVKQNWFLSVDASGARTCIKPSCEFDTNNSVKMGLTDLCDDCRGLSSDVNRMKTLPIPSPGGASKKNVTSKMVTEFNLEKFVDKTTDFQSNICSEEYCIGTDSRPKKKRKVGNIEDTCHSPRYEDDCNLLEASCKDTLKHEAVSSRNVMVGVVRKSPGGGIPHEQNGKGNDHFDSKDRVEFKGQSLPSTTQKPLASGERKEENASDSKMGHELARDAPTNCSEVINVNVPDHSARMMDASGGVREVNADGSKMKKKQLQKTAREAQDATEMEQTGIGESIKSYFETHESEKKEGESMPLEHGHEVMMLSHSKTSDHVGPEPLLKEASLLQDANAIMKPEISSGTKKKGKRAKKSLNTKQEQSGTQQARNGTSALGPLSTDHILGETGCKEGISNHEGKEVQLLFDSFIVDAVAEVPVVNRIEGDTEILTQAEQTSTEVCSGKKSADRLAQSSASNGRADLPALETGNPIMEFNQVDKSSKNIKDKDRKASKRSKNQKLTVSQVQQDLNAEDQRVGNKALATKETSISLVNFEKEYRHVDSSMSAKTEQKLNEGDTGHKEGLTNHEGKDIQLRFDAVAEVQGVNKIKGDTVILAQAEQCSAEVCSGKKSADRMAQSSADSCRADLPALETGNPILEFNQVDKSNKNAENKDRKASKRRKNQKLTVSQVQEDLSVEDQRVGNRALTTKETSISFVNSEQEYRHVDSSMVLSTKTEQKLNEAHGIAENTYNLVETSEKEGEGINFKQYFVLGQYKDKVDSGVEVNKATKSNQEMETSKSVKANVDPHISNSTELQSSIISYEKKTENKCRSKGVRSKEDSAQGRPDHNEIITDSFERPSRASGKGAKNSRPSTEDSAQGPDHNEIIIDSFNRPSRASGKGAKNSRPSEMCKATLQNPDEGLAAISSHLNKKNCRSSDNSSSGRSEILPGKQRNKIFKLDMNATSLMLMKIPQKKSLLMKPGGIFQDDSEESSGDENGNIHSDSSTLSPSDCSSMSGHSVEESGLSQDSTRNGYGDAEGKSTGRRNMSKFDLSESKDDITMDMILKSSKRFRKAKLLASQNEEENES